MIVSKRRIEQLPFRHVLEDALDDDPETYVVVANETARHRDTVEQLIAAGFRGTVLVEKPIFDMAGPVPDHGFQRLSVAYNLRFHPVLQRLRAVLAEDTVISASIYVGQYLPDWRPGTDYRDSYSAHRSAGGGALRDLSHDLDYGTWLFGGWTRVAALGGHLSALEIDSDDVFALLMATQECPVVTVQLSYLDRMPRRRIVVNAQRQTIEADLIAGTLTINGEREEFTMDRDTTYRAMHDALLGARDEDACDALSAMDTLKLVEAAEQAASGGCWVSR
ncbi:hypothetical protein NF701_17800 (plasmid) [Sphingomonadaceae bacterium OTU29THOMA1]|nr:hypothetical protein NF701_17800 [Sphingomonadaceae bacterium OTU29THOMA1]